ncbi:MAG: DNRLRE domain-containing protein, partial [Planctomycetota bacterium]
MRIRQGLTAAAATLAAATVAMGESVTAGAAKDNTLYESTSGSLSNGAGQYCFAGRTGQPVNSRRRAVLQFDLEGVVPRGATIDSVELQLFMSRSNAAAGPRAVDLHRVTEDWGEAGSDADGGAGPGSGGGDGAAAQAGDATWVHSFFPGTFWSDGPGGSFEAAAAASRVVVGIGFYTWSGAAMTDQVQQWLDDPSSNFGWILIGDESSSGTAKRFNTHEDPNANTRPVLTIEFTPAAA